MKNKANLMRFEFELSADIVQKLEIPMQVTLNLQKHEMIGDITLLFIKYHLACLYLIEPSEKPIHKKGIIL